MSEQATTTSNKAEIERRKSPQRMQQWSDSEVDPPDVHNGPSVPRTSTDPSNTTERSIPSTSIPLPQQHDHGESLTAILASAGSSQRRNPAFAPSTVNSSSLTRNPLAPQGHFPRHPYTSNAQQLNSSISRRGILSTTSPDYTPHMSKMTAAESGSPRAESVVLVKEPHRLPVPVIMGGNAGNKLNHSSTLSGNSQHVSPSNSAGISPKQRSASPSAMKVISGLFGGNKNPQQQRATKGTTNPLADSELPTPTSAHPSEADTAEREKERVMAQSSRHNVQAARRNRNISLLLLVIASLITIAAATGCGIFLYYLSVSNLKKQAADKGKAVVDSTLSQLEGYRQTITDASESLIRYVDAVQPNTTSPDDVINDLNATMFNQWTSRMTQSSEMYGWALTFLYPKLEGYYSTPIPGSPAPPPIQYLPIQNLTEQNDGSCPYFCARAGDPTFDGVAKMEVWYDVLATRKREYVYSCTQPKTNGTVNNAFALKEIPLGENTYGQDDLDGDGSSTFELNNFLFNLKPLNLNGNGSAIDGLWTAPSLWTSADGTSYYFLGYNKMWIRDTEGSSSRSNMNTTLGVRQAIVTSIFDRIDRWFDTISSIVPADAVDEYMLLTDGKGKVLAFSADGVAGDPRLANCSTVVLESRNVSCSDLSALHHPNPFLRTLFQAKGEQINAASSSTNSDWVDVGDKTFLLINQEAFRSGNLRIVATYVIAQSRAIGSLVNYTIAVVLGSVAIIVFASSILILIGALAVRQQMKTVAVVAKMTRFISVYDIEGAQRFLNNKGSKEAIGNSLLRNQFQQIVDNLRAYQSFLPRNLQASYIAGGGSESGSAGTGHRRTKNDIINEHVDTMIGSLGLIATGVDGTDTATIANSNTDRHSKGTDDECSDIELGVHEGDAANEALRTGGDEAPVQHAGVRILGSRGTAASEHSDSEDKQAAAKRRVFAAHRLTAQKLRIVRGTIMIVDYGNLGTASPATAGANINAFLALCIPIIERFGGVVDLLQASQLLVSFNYHLPVVKHEDIAAKCALVIMAVIQRGKEEENDEASAIIATNGEEEEGVSTTPKNPALYLRTANIAIAIASGPNVVGTVGSDSTQKARVVTGEGVDMAKKLVALQRVLGSMELSSANGPATTAASSHQKTSSTIVGSGQISVSSPAPQHQSAAAINADNYGGILMTEATMEKCSVLGVPVDVVAPRWLQPGRARNVAVYELVGFDLKKRDPPEWAKNIANGFQLLRRKKYADAIAALDKPAADGFRQAVRLRAICHRNIEMRKTRQQLNGIGSASTRNTTNGNISTASDSDAPGGDCTYERKETLWEGHNDEVTALKYNSQLLMRLQQQQQQQGSSSIVAANQQTSGSGGSVPNSPRRAAPASGLINVSNLLTFGSIGMGASGNPAIDASLPKLPSHGGSYNNSAQLLHNSGNSGGGGGNLLNTNFLGNPQLQTQPPRLGGAFNAPEDDIGAIRVQLLRQQAHSTTNGHSSSQHASAAAVATPKVEEEPEPQEADEDRLFSIFVLPNHHDDDDEPPRRDAATKANSGEDEKRSHGGVVGSAVRSFSNGSGQNETKNDANSKPTGQNGKAAAFENDEMPLLFTDMSGQNYTRSKSILGKGAFGLVTSAMDDDGTIVAVKTMSIGGNISSHNAGAKEEAFRARIEELVHEVGVLAEVRHANIAGYVSAAILPSHFCIIMEYLSGGSLRTLISSQHYGKIPAKPLCAYLKGILCGLQYLHEAHGYVHCDIKPDNIMLTSDGTCKLTDFGTAVLMKKEEQILKKFQDSGIEGSSGADSKNDRSGSDEEHVGLFASSMLRGSNPVLTVPKAVASSVTPATSAPAAAGPLVRGTPRYMAPEAALGDWTPASDVYSLGITLIELATGQHPWRHIKGGDTAFLMRLAMDKTMRPLLPPSLRSGGASYNKASGANPLLVDAGEAEDVISEDSAPAVPMDNLLLEFADMCLAHDPTQRASVAQLLLLLPNN